MIIEKISFLNIRKTTEAHYKFIPTTNIVIGENGAGKTTIIEAVFLLSNTKSFRKKQNKALLQKGKKKIEVQAVLKDKEENKTIKLSIEKNKKKVYKNNSPIKKTSELLNENPIVCMSPEEIDIIESYKNEKIKYFDKIIFKIDKNHIKNIREYRKLLQYRNMLLEQKKTTEPWDKPLVKTAIEIWKTRESFFKEIIKKFNIVQKETKTEEYQIDYFNKKTYSTKEYREKLKENQEKTSFGPHKDTVLFKIKEKELQEHGSQGEKKLLKYLLKLTELDVLKDKKKKTPIFLLDDFFDKLDSKNIMKIFVYFHCKFQTIITTTEINPNISKKMFEADEEKIKIIQCQQ